MMRLRKAGWQVRQEANCLTRRDSRACRNKLRTFVPASLASFCSSVRFMLCSLPSACASGIARRTSMLGNTSYRRFVNAVQQSRLPRACRREVQNLKFGKFGYVMK